MSFNQYIREIIALELNDSNRINEDHPEFISEWSDCVQEKINNMSIQELIDYISDYLDKK